ncbi:HEAT repeat domain-containing protein [Stenotrophomonas sp. 278]|uniref:HEAT repeat domain-containing protein n=1 Tax=Stenotrophomonas sp. 278 TaxID=2479851 RepID=UPI000F6725AA|nr:HEAT repeat domain-containing protein [Stenotrophomonas sp. 278]RRU13909.1 HEAT repeat domain-containing protein [Stenotrophomonas sp. 278]
MHVFPETQAGLRDQVESLLQPFVPVGTDPLLWVSSRPPRGWIELDLRLRSWYAAPITGSPLLQVQLLDQSPPLLRDAALFLGSCSGNGFVRQLALSNLLLWPGRLPLVAALLRCNDWVQPVRTSAQRAVMALLSSCRHEDIVQVWPLAVRLRQAGRVDPQWVGASLEAWLCEVAQRPVLEALMSHDDAQTRLHAYALAFDQDPAWSASRRRDALHDADPRVARLALRHVLEHADGAEAETLCRHALTTPSRHVRLEALRVLVARPVDDASALVEAALFDRSAGVRSWAVWQRTQAGEDKGLELWRDELATHRRGKVRVALEGLADHAETEDALRFEAALPTLGPKGQRTCLRGLLRAERGVSLSVLLRSLDHDNAALQSEIDQAQPLWTATFTPEVLAGLAAQPRSDNAHERLMKRLRTLSRWAHLELLLDFQPVSAEAQQWRAGLVDYWLLAEVGYTPLSDERRRTLVRRLREGAHGLGSVQSARVVDLLLKA